MSEVKLMEEILNNTIANSSMHFNGVEREYIYKAMEAYKNQFPQEVVVGDAEIDGLDNPCKNPKPECHCFWSPIKNEREFQERLMKRISSHYPNAYTPWQYFNGLLFMALAYAGKEKEYDEELKVLDIPNTRSHLTGK